MFCIAVNETLGPRTIEEHRLERRKESATCSHNFYIHPAKSLLTATTAKDALTCTLIGY